MIFTDDELTETRQLLVRYARRYSSSRYAGKLDLSGVVQKTLAAVAGSTPPEDSPGRVRWFKAIFRRNLTSEIRKLQSLSRDTAREQELQTDPVGWTETPSRQAANAETLALLLVALTRLPDDQQTAIRRYYLEGNSLSDVARSMNRPRTTVARLVQSGLETLRTFARLDE